MRSVTESGNNDQNEPHAADQLVGSRIRIRRKELGLSQDELARRVGVTFQQIQKYERAANRVSASKLFEVARALKVPPSYFFEELGALEAQPTASGILADPEFNELAQTLSKLRGAVRRRIIDLVRVLAQEGAERA